MRRNPTARRARPFAAALVAAAVVLGALAAPAGAQAERVVRAGVGVADATWNVGSCAGQYCDTRDPDLASGDVDPHLQNRYKAASYGVQSRLTMRAIVVEGVNGERIALLKSDQYLAQDAVLRRAGQLLAEAGSSITPDQILHAASHNHSSPYYTTPAWGVWIFQDVFDLRAFEFTARAMAEAILEAEASMVPARMGATTVQHTIFKGNVVGPQVADDGSPAGYPRDFGDTGLVVLRFDDLSDPAAPRPLATFVNFGQHPEGYDGYDLITGDYVGHLERMVGDATGAPLVFSQGDVGSAEGPYEGRPNANRLPSGEYRAWAHVGHAQVERGARYLADSVLEGWDAVGRGEGQVPSSSTFDVDVRSAWVPGPVSHPYPSVSNCRTETTVEGDPGAPVVGFPDCGRGDSPTAGQLDPLMDELRAQGVPVPENYDAPAVTAVEENARLRLQAFKLGDVLLASCACEAQVDLILNLESRTDRVQGNQWLGYDWSARCSDADGDRTWTCERGPYDGPLEVSDAAYQRMRAQVFNDAAGWDAPENALAAGSEPADPAEILGNFTHTELPPELGYGLSVGVGHAGDFNGYTVSYREYMAYDSYRKALTSYGPHTADYMATRLMAMAGAMNGGPEPDAEVTAAIGLIDEARQTALVTALGALSGPAYDAWQATLPDDVGPAAALVQPEDVTRFDAATFTWRGGSNAVDNPLARVERLDPATGTWAPFADMDGEVQTMVDLPNGVEGVADTYAGSQEWVWTASFEAYTADREVLGQTPAGTYRFVVDGEIRQARATEPYALTSEPFEVRPWDGIAVSGIAALEDGRVAVDVAPVAYPRTYESPFRYIADDGRTTFCRTCSFRPWASTADLASVTVTVERADGTTERVAAARAADGRWYADAALATGDRAHVLPGDVLDEHGERNGAGASMSTSFEAPAP